MIRENTRKELARSGAYKFKAITKYITLTELRSVIDDFEGDKQEKYGHTYLVKRSKVDPDKYALFARPKNKEKKMFSTLFDLLCSNTMTRPEYWYGVKKFIGK